jgi:hypothetical protein
MPTTQELRLDQIEREREEHAKAKEAGLPAEQAAAERRADKASYLKRKLAQQQARDGE